MRKLSAVVLVLMMAVAGCGSKTAATAGGAAAAASSSAAAVPGASGAMSSPGSMMSTGAMSGTQCPTSNTRSFAKTRFVSDLGGAAFLIRRYLYQPYTQGTFTKGHSGRTVALIKAAATAATVVHLLKNASLNAKANPTLCKLVAAPLASLTSTVSGLTSGSLLGGGSGLGVLGGLGGAVSGLLGKTKDAGVPVTEQPPTAS